MTEYTKTVAITKQAHSHLSDLAWLSKKDMSRYLTDLLTAEHAKFSFNLDAKLPPIQTDKT